MALPPGVNGKTLTFGRGSFMDGSAVAGRVTISAPKNLVHLPSGRQLFSGEMTRKLEDGTAVFEELVPNDAPGLSRYGWTYTAKFEVQGARQQPESFDFVLFNAGPSNVDGDTLVSVPSSTGEPVSVSVLTADAIDSVGADYVQTPGSELRAALDGIYVTPGNIPAGYDDAAAQAAVAPTLAQKADLVGGFVKPAQLPTATASAAGLTVRPRVYDIRDYVLPGETLVMDGSGVGNNTAIIQRAVDAQSALPFPSQIFFPNGRYRLVQAYAHPTRGTKASILWKTKVGILGESQTGTVFLAASDCTPFFAAYGTPTAPLTDCVFETFTIDGAAQTNATYTTEMKGMHITFMLRPVWDRVTIKNTWATGLGCDFLQDYKILNVTVQGCGRGIREKGLDPLTVSGGSGIGIGTGYTRNERGVIVGALLLDNGKNGLFYETQSQTSSVNHFWTRGHSVVGGVSAGNHTGLHDCGCDGLDVAGMQIVDNTYAGLLLAGTILTEHAGYNGHFNGTIARNGTIADTTSGGVVIGEAPDGKWLIEGTIYSNSAGIRTKADAVVGPRVTINADIRDNLGPGIALTSTNTAVTKALSINSRVIANGRDSASADRQGVLVNLNTEGMSISGKIGDDQDVKTQQVGIHLRGSTRSTSGARITADARGNVTNWVNAHTLTDLAFSGVGFDPGTTGVVPPTTGSGTVAGAIIADTMTVDGPLAGSSATEGTGVAPWAIESTAVSPNAAVVTKSGGVAKATAGNQSTYATVSTASGDMKVRVSWATLLTSPANRRATAVFRYSDTSNTWRVYSHTAGTYVLSKLVAGTSTAYTSSVTAANNDVVDIVASGSSITVSVNGTPVAFTVGGTPTTTVTDTALQTNTKAGFALQASSGTSTITDLDKTSEVTQFAILA